MLVNFERKAFSFLFLASVSTIILLAGCNNSPQPSGHDDSSGAAASKSVKKDKNATKKPVSGDTVKSKDTAMAGAAVADSNDSAAPGFEWGTPVDDTTKSYIYLTFDDGPQPGTMNCYHIVRDLGVKATFFMVGMHAWDQHQRSVVDSIRNGYPDILLANHSYTHANNHYHYFYEHPYMSLDDFLKAQQSLNVPFKIVRLPGNSAWVRQGEVRASKLVKPVSLLLDSLGYNVIGWDVEWNFNHKTARPVQSVSSMLKLVNEAVNRHESHTRRHVVILSHDRMFRHPEDADSLYQFISELKKNPAYVFETIGNYPKLKQPRIKSE